MKSYKVLKCTTGAGCHSLAPDSSQPPAPCSPWGPQGPSLSRGFCPTLSLSLKCCSHSRLGQGFDPTCKFPSLPSYTSLHHTTLLCARPIPSPSESTLFICLQFSSPLEYNLYLDGVLCLLLYPSVHTVDTLKYLWTRGRKGGVGGGRTRDPLPQMPFDPRTCIVEGDRPSSLPISLAAWQL